MKFASVCSGIGAPELAWSGLGWSPAWCSEIEPFPSAVLAHRFGTPNLGDMNTIDPEAATDEHGAIDVLVGGTPCQSFSTAGLRAGMDDARGNLARRFVELARDLRPRWVVWENVPGCLSTNGGRDFGSIVGALAECGYGWAYRILDAQFFRVAQRRRRVFVVGCLGDWRGAAAVLLERSGLRGDPAPSREAGADVAGALTASFGKGGPDLSHAEARWLTGAFVADVAGTLAPGAHPGGVNGQDAYSGQLIAVDTYNQSIGKVFQTVRSSAEVPCVMAHGQGGAEIRRDQSPTLTCNHEAPIVFDETQVTSRENRSRCAPGDPSPTLARGARPPTIAVHHRQDPITRDECGLPVDTDGTGPFGVSDGATVRRLTPRECERLQGFPDDWTAIGFKGKPAADAPRYRAIGNSMAVPVMRWIGERIGMVEGVRGRGVA